MEINNEQGITANWLDTDSRTHIWEIIYKKENEHLNNGETNEIKAKQIIKTRLLKVYELVVLFSSLSCAALVGISDSSNEDYNLLIIYDSIRGFGIVSSSLGAIVSLSTCMIISALPQQHIIDFLRTFMKYSNVPVFTTVLSIFSMMTCASLQFKKPVMYIILPYSTICFFYGLYVYNKLRKKMIKLIDRTSKITE